MTRSLENDNGNKKPGPFGANGPDDEPENQELRWAQRKMPDDEPLPQPVRSVFRRTELHGTALSPAPNAIRKKRKRTPQELKNPTGTVSYTAFETSCKDFICSLMERHDIMRDEMFLHVADLQQKIEILEHRLDQDRYGSSDIPGVNE
jgi:hypothetical protein